MKNLIATKILTKIKNISLPVCKHIYQCILFNIEGDIMTEYVKHIENIERGKKGDI